MNKEKANERLNALEAEAEKLREIINKEDSPEPKPGEVWSPDGSRRLFLYTLDREHCELPSPSIADNQVELFSDDYFQHAGECHGTFSEVFVRRDEIAEQFIEREKVREVIEAAKRQLDFGNSLYARGALDKLL